MSDVTDTNGPKSGKKDLITAIGLVGFAIGGFVFLNPENSSVRAGPGGISWQTMPLIYASLLLVLSLAYVVQSIQKIRAENKRPDVLVDAEKAAENRVILLRRIVSIGLLVIYVSLLQTFGFAIMTPLFLIALFRLYARGSWRGDITISLIGGLLLWGLFVRILHLNLKGNLWDPVTPFLFDLLKVAGF